MTTITPVLWFDADLAEPLAYYAGIFPDFVVEHRQPAADGTIFMATLQIGGQRLMMINGGPAHAGFRESVSLFVSVEDQGEVDRLWELLTREGEPGRCGWLKDRYGLSWQIVPRQLGEFLGGDDPVRVARAREAMLGMDKLVIEELRAAYDA